MVLWYNAQFTVLYVRDTTLNRPQHHFRSIEKFYRRSRLSDSIQGFPSHFNVVTEDFNHVKRILKAARVISSLKSQFNTKKFCLQNRKTIFQYRYKPFLSVSLACSRHYGIEGNEIQNFANFTSRQSVSLGCFYIFRFRKHALTDEAGMQSVRNIIL